MKYITFHNFIVIIVAGPKTKGNKPNTNSISLNFCLQFNVYKFFSVISYVTLLKTATK